MYYEASIPTTEDKVLQRAVAMLLGPIYEQDFLGCSFGFRPGRSPHQALDELWRSIMGMGGRWVLEVESGSFSTLWTLPVYIARSTEPRSLSIRGELELIQVLEVTLNRCLRWFGLLLWPIGIGVVAYPIQPLWGLPTETA